MEWNARLQLGKAAEEWGSKARLRFLLLEEHTLGAAKTTTHVGSGVASLTDLRSNSSEYEVSTHPISHDLPRPPTISHRMHACPTRAC